VFVPGKLFKPSLTHTSLLQKFVNYSQIIFLTLGPGTPKTLKDFYSVLCCYKMRWNITLLQNAHIKWYVICHKFYEHEIKTKGWSHKTFLHKFTYSFCKLDVSLSMQEILLMFIKWSSLQISVSKFIPK